MVRCYCLTIFFFFRLAHETSTDKTMLFHPYARLIYLLTVRMAIGLCLVLQTHLLSASLVSSSCSSSQGFAADFLQTLRHRNALVFGYALPAIRVRSGLTPVRT